MNKIIIAAVSKNSVLGKNGKIPWHSKQDLSHFRNTTLGYPLIMGRKTFEAIDKELDQRVLIVLSREMKNDFSQLKHVDFVVENLEEAYKKAEVTGKEKVFIIGGAEIFEQTIHHADEMIISHFDFEIDGDIYFPKIEPAEWTNQVVNKFDNFKIVRYIRRSNN